MRTELPGAVVVDPPAEALPRLVKHTAHEVSIQLRECSPALGVSRASTGRALTAGKGGTQRRSADSRVRRGLASGQTMRARAHTHAAPSVKPSNCGVREVPVPGALIN